MKKSEKQRLKNRLVVSQLDGSQQCNFALSTFPIIVSRYISETGIDPACLGYALVSILDFFSENEDLEENIFIDRFLAYCNELVVNLNNNMEV